MEVGERDMPTEQFICRTLAEWFDEPCNFTFCGTDATDIINDPEWCEEHCGNIAPWECWKKLFEAEAKRSDVNLFQNGNSSEKPNNCEPQTDCPWK